MAKTTHSRRELLDRLSGIEENDEAAWSDPRKQDRITQLKEEWFLDTFKFLICLPKDTHIWCGSWELMAPLLETFYNYFKDKRNDSPLKILWRRISEEMRQCTQCTCQYHQAQEMYSSEYESSTIGPLLNVLRSLDEERVTQHLKELNARIGRGEYNPELHNAEVVCVMFEVLMFPILLDDQALANEFQIFIEAIDNCHELTLAGHQQYPGVYALFFLKSRRTRSIGHRLAGSIGKLRKAADLEPLQPLLKKCICYLETEVLPPTSATSRPRVQLERISVWLGIKALLGFLEPPAFEEGILERYPIFLSIVLNHVSDDSLEFPHAVNCLRLLFEMLGCKLWLRTTLSPSVMRNTLLGQCFHTRNEKSHKDIFDLFQPFLQSLEALQDGEHEKQRRHFLYFLLHQVKMSSNFSDLMRKKACQIAILIIHRGYKMNPPCPPFECAHMWGPSLICSLKDSSLYDSLRQPAFDLIQTILVSDAAALATLLSKDQLNQCNDSGIFADIYDDGEEVVFCYDEEKDTSCWKEFSSQNKLTSRECRGWMCVPVLWFDVLVESNPSVFPTSTSKAVLWALSRFAMVELDNSMEMTLSVRDLQSTYSGKISFVWETPTGSDDGGDGKDSKNSVKLSSMCIPLIILFKRFTAHFILQMEQGELWMQWKWEPRMAESLILLLLDPNNDVRRVNRLILEYVSKTRGLARGLQFLSSGGSSLSPIYLGLSHAMKLVRLDLVLSKFHNLHHCFFVLYKLLKEALAAPLTPTDQSDSSNISSFSSQGGFLRQPLLDAPALGVLDQPNVVDLKARERFCLLLCEVLWSSLRKCFVEGKTFINNKNSQMTCVRILEILPVVFERLSSTYPKLSGNEVDAFDFKWLDDFMDWGNSSLDVIARYWKQSLNKLLDVLKGLCHHSSARIKVIETLISDKGVAINELKEQISSLSVSLSTEVSCSAGISMLKPKPSTVESFPVEKSFSSLSTNPSTFEDDEVLVLESPEFSKCQGMDKIILLSDDEAEEGISSDVNCHLNDNKLDPAAERSILRSDHERKSVISIRTSKNSESFHTSSAAKNVELSSEKHKSDATKKNLAPASVAPTKGVDSVIQEVNNLSGALDALPIQDKGQPFNKITSHKIVCSKNIGQASSMGTSTANIDIEVKDAILKDLIRDDEEDPWERAVKSARRPPSLLTKPGPSVPKRQVIQLNMPGQNKSFNLHRDSVVKRLKRPRLDEWYRPILEMDYFSTVRLSSANDDEKNSSKLKKVPVYFQSPDHYEDIFRPLVLEEFKAQLYSSYLETSSEEMCCGSISVLSVERVDDFHLIRCIPGDSESAASRGCSENDLVLLTRQPLQNSTHDIHVVGKVEKREKDNKRRSIILVIRFYLQNGSSRMNKAKRFLTDRSKWYLSRIMSITPQLREFQALSSLRDIPVLPIILKPTIHSVGDNGLRKVELAQLSQPLQQVLKSSFNESQLLAISAAIGTYGSRKDFELSLVQGPPGTGKTRTILAIVSGLLASGSQQKNDTVKQPSNSWGPSNTSSINSRPQLSLSAAVVRAWQDAALARQLNEEVEKNSRSKEYSMRVRVLICAQSNAAVDELVSRISKEGLYGIDGARYKPYLVRVGNPKTVHPSSLPFFIDTLVDQRLAEEKMNGSDGKNDMIGETATSLRSNLEKLVDRIRFYEAKRANIRNGNLDHKCSSEDGASIGDDEPEISDAAVDARLKNLNEQRREICKDLAAAQAREKKNSEESWALRNKLRRTILREAEIVVSTLSGCGGDLYAACSESLSNYKFGISSEHTLFDAVVIDEAAQALEPATLIPLQLLKTNGTKCIMVGDPKQLPATVLSQVASKFLYECSMFERLQRAGHPVVMLTHQYRMHPEICKFPSFHFYNNKLLNGDRMTNKVAPFHDNRNLGPYVFFDVTDGRECDRRNSGALSLYNEHEADAAVEVLRFFQKRYPLEFVGGRIGIISPYKSQVSLLRSRISNTFGSDTMADMEFNTVDGFQGREVDILIFSTVRASDQSYSMPGISSSVIGFVADVRRMNVALTRAKLSLWILGNAKTLLTNQNWASLLKNAEERNLIVTMTRPYESVFKKSCSVAKESPDLKQSRGYAMGTDDRKRKDIKNVAEKHKRRPDSDGAQNISMNRKCTGEALLQRDIKLLKPEKLSRTGKHGTKGKGQGEEIHCDRTQAKSASTMLAPKRPITHEESGSETKLPGVQLEADGPERLRALNQGVSRETRESSADDVKQSTSMKEDIHQEREVNGSTVTNSTRPKDLVTARKQQRDAVEALLPSALLSSKKPETTSKSLSFKRPRSPTGKCVIKPAKHRKDR